MPVFFRIYRKPLLLGFCFVALSTHWVYAQSSAPDLAGFNAQRLHISRLGTSGLADSALPTPAEKTGLFIR